MSHRNAPLTPEGRRRLVTGCQHRPIAHVAAEAGVSRQCLSKWVGRYRAGGEAALQDRSSAPARRPTRTPQPVITEIIRLRKKHRWSAVTIAAELRAQGTPVAVVTVTRHLRAHGLNRRRWLDPETGEPNREQPGPGTITARYPGHMLHLDVKKSGKIPDGGGWRVHGRGSEQGKASDRGGTAVSGSVTPICIRRSMGSPGWRTPNRTMTRRRSLRSASCPGRGCSWPRTALPASRAS